MFTFLVVPPRFFSSVNPIVRDLKLALFGAGFFLFLSIEEGLATGASGQLGGTRGYVMRLVGAFGHIRDSVTTILSAIPRVPYEVAQALAIVFFPTQGSTLQPSLLAGLVGILLLLVPVALLRIDIFKMLRPRYPDRSYGMAARRLAFDVIDLAVMTLVAVILVDALFSTDTLGERFALAIIDMVLRVRLVMFIPLALLRPGEPELRLMPADESQVARAIPLVWAVVILGAAFTTIIPVLFEAGIPSLHSADEPWIAGQAFAALTGTIVSLGALAAVNRYFQPAVPMQPRLQILARFLVVIFWFAWVYGVISLDFDFYYAFSGLAILGATTLLADRFLTLAKAKPDSLSDEGDQSNVLISAALRRCTWVSALAIATVLLSRYVLTQAMIMYTPERWASIEAGLINAFAYMICGYIAFELLRVWTRIKFAVRIETPHLDHEDADEPQPASRLSTVMPLVQGFVGVALLGVTFIAALSELGVNITPLLAGAGIFGLAISFGSQSLVRDIVAGLFFMIDDAFRVGEYIEAGRLRGTVERISLRSLRMRHHNGQMHTVPFGQLGSITNHSRDWLTVKFNLRFASDTDIEKVRKMVKRIGQDLLSHDELGREFLLPLKMQGVADVAENTLVLRFKFTVKPGKPTLVQREAMKQMIIAFRANGIAFGAPSVLVQSNNGPAPDLADAAAATQIINAAKARAEAEAAAQNDTSLVR